jgi:hypothetical protein
VSGWWRPVPARGALGLLGGISTGDVVQVGAGVLFVGLAVAQVGTARVYGARYDRVEAALRDQPAGSTSGSA